MTTIAIVGSKGIPACYGGFETLVENMVKHLRKRFSFIVYCSTPAYPMQLDTFQGARLEYVNLEANGAQSIPYDVISMLRACREADIVLVLGISGCLFLPLIKLFNRRQFIVHLDGVDWRRAKWGFFARNFLKLSEWVAAQSADQIIADNKVIQQYIKERYGKDSFLVAYGGDNAVSDLPQRNRDNLSVVALHKVAKWDVPVDPEVRFDRYAILVCRIEPENNIHAILEAFEHSARIPLVAVGNWSESEYGRALREQFSGCSNIQLLDPIYETERLFSLRSNASLYVHGHSAGGTNPSLVEAMCLGLPVFAFDVPFNRATTLDAAVYFSTPEALADLLRDTDWAVLRSLGTTMRKLGNEEYSWAQVSQRYAALFDAVGQQLDVESLPAGPVRAPVARGSAGLAKANPLQQQETAK